MKTTTRPSKKTAAALALSQRIAETLASYNANVAAGNHLAAAGDRDALARLGRC